MRCVDELNNCHNDDFANDKLQQSASSAEAARFLADCFFTSKSNVNKQLCMFREFSFSGAIERKKPNQGDGFLFMLAHRSGFI